jgi:hypothetical protein
MSSLLSRSQQSDPLHIRPEKCAGYCSFGRVRKWPPDIAEGRRFGGRWIALAFVFCSRTWRWERLIPLWSGDLVDWAGRPRG